MFIQLHSLPTAAYKGRLESRAKTQQTDTYRHDTLSTESFMNIKQYSTSTILKSKSWLKEIISGVSLGFLKKFLVAWI